MLIIYNHSENSARAEGSKSKGLLGFDKSNKTFSCESSDLSCAGVNLEHSLPDRFDVMVEESKNIKTFKHFFTKKDDENEIQYWLYKATDNSGIKFMIFND